MTGPVSSSGPAAAPARQQSAKHKQLVEAAQAFEAVFLRQMIGSMRQASLGEDVLGSSATDQFRSISDDRLADQMASTGGFGISRMLIKQFDKQVEKPEPGAAK
ncbi:MAG TPA: rod-binding protein [Sphingomicrobium sp.]|nr:rod-binding protein [Sphingomicrobium sp.]